MVSTERVLEYLDIPPERSVSYTPNVPNTPYICQDDGAKGTEDDAKGRCYTYPTAASEWDLDPAGTDVSTLGGCCTLCTSGSNSSSSSKEVSDSIKEVHVSGSGSGSGSGGQREREREREISRGTVGSAAGSSVSAAQPALQLHELRLASREMDPPTLRGNAGRSRELANWPWEGAVEFKSVWMRYRDNPHVLKGSLLLVI